FVFLKWFVTPLGTRKVVCESDFNILCERFAVTQEQAIACREFFLQSRILRRNDKEYELAHDTVAKKVAEKRFYLPPNLKRKIAKDVNPFKGLAAFDENDNEFFFGRAKAAKEILDKLNRFHFAVLTGSSGTGKSSLIKAGVFPLLRKEGYRLIEIVRPGADPVRHLTATLAKMNAATLPEKGYVLLIDQFEELLTHNGQETEIERFMQILRELLDTPQSYLSQFQEHHRVKIVVTIRSDFEPQFERRPWLKDRWQTGRYVVPPLTLEELLEVVERPAELAAVHFRPPELVNDIIREVYGKEAPLPLLSFAMSRMYEESLQNDCIIDRDIYEDVGIIGSLSRHADGIYETLPDDAHRRTMRHIMLRMLSIEGDQMASRRVSRKELTYVSEEENKRVDFVLAKLTGERLVLGGRPEGVKPPPGEAIPEASKLKPFYEPAHDALVWGWGSLHRWKNEFGNINISLRERLRMGYLAWRDHQNDDEYLWNNHPQLPALDEVLKGKDNWLNKAETEFVEKSWKMKVDLEEQVKREEREAEAEKFNIELAAREREASLREETITAKFLAEKEKLAMQIEVENEKKQSRKFWYTLTAVGILGLAVFAYKAYSNGEVAKSQRKLAEKNLKLKETESAEAAEQKAIALRAKDTADSISIVLRTQKDSAEYLRSLADEKTAEAMASARRAKRAEFRANNAFADVDLERQKALAEADAAKLARAKAEEEVAARKKVE
ncbi:MAG: AAA family ATPase, partial [Bacteroidota bacterium]